MMQIIRFFVLVILFLTHQSYSFVAKQGSEDVINIVNIPCDSNTVDGTLNCDGKNKNSDVIVNLEIKGLKKNCDTDDFPVSDNNDPEIDNLVLEEDPKIKSDKLKKQEMESKGYKFYDKFGFYKFHQNPVVWTTARDICISEGAHLVVINSNEEANIVLNIFRKYPYANVKEPTQMLIGMHDLNIEGHFETVTGGTVATSGYTKWGPGQPDSGRDENCGSIISSNGWLNDFYCTYPSTFMCEKEWAN